MEYLCNKVAAATHTNNKLKSPLDTITLQAFLRQTGDRSWTAQRTWAGSVRVNRPTFKVVVRIQRQ